MMFLCTQNDVYYAEIIHALQCGMLSYDDFPLIVDIDSACGRSAAEAAAVERVPLVAIALQAFIVGHDVFTNACRDGFLANPLVVLGK